MQTKTRLIIILLIVLTLMGCKEVEPTEEPTEITTQAYPAPTEDDGYPVPTKAVDTESGYPIKVTKQSTHPQGPEFNISVPVKGNDQVVKGDGPAGVPIRLVDVSEVGLVLAETVIDENGLFTFNFEEPLEAGHMIGLMLGDLTGTDLDENDFIYSDTYYSRPLIGILFDIVLVE